MQYRIGGNCIGIRDCIAGNILTYIQDAEHFMLIYMPSEILLARGVEPKTVKDIRSHAECSNVSDQLKRDAIKLFNKNK